jgi:DNA repair protein RecN (Recombination protein N)
VGQKKLTARSDQLKAQKTVHNFSIKQASRASVFLNFTSTKKPNMLLHLSVKNYALIDHLELDFQPNLTTITGETGSGKSIILGALGLILGERADSAALKSNSIKCVIEGQFNLKNYGENYLVNNFFERYDLDYQDVSIIRREITPSGKSRAFINDTPVNLNQLKELSTQLVDIHSQHQTLKLNTNAFQLDVVDAFAQHDDALKAYHQTWQEHKQLDRELVQLLETERQSKLDANYFQFQFNELDEAKLQLNEESSVEEELNTLSNAEEIIRSLSGAVDVLSNSDNNILLGLKDVKANLFKISGFHSSIGALSERVESSYLELQDITAELEQLEGEVQYNPERIEHLNDRLNLVNGLLQKHRVSTVQELLVIRDELDVKLGNVNSIDEQIVALREKLAKVEAKMNKRGEAISAKRQKVIPGIEKQVAELLAQLAMPNAQLQVVQERAEQPSGDGFDKITFEFKANKGGQFHHISKVASGGELSRLMLTIKALVARRSTLPTIIFDEIDTGISGDVADKAGGILRGMAENMQVLSITHLPQIASQGHHHLRVYKDNSGEATQTHVVPLTPEERVSEIAKMLSGEDLSEAAIENAKVLLERGK